MSTGFDVHIPSGTAAKVLPWLVAGALGLTSGGGASTWWDVTGARAYKDRVAEQIAENEKLHDDVTALQAQNAQLLRLLDGSIVCTRDVDAVE